MKKLLVCLLLCSLFSCKPDPDYLFEAAERIWLAQPAEEWVEALPLGNGRLGMMVFGKTEEERIQLNDDSLWPADLNWEEPPGTSEDLQNIRQALFDGKHAEADRLFVEKFSNKEVKRSHQTLGDLFVEFNHSNISNYHRELDLRTAIAKMAYQTDNAKVTQEAFVSHPHQVMVVHYTTDAAEGLSGRIRLTRPGDEGFPTAVTRSVGNDQLVMQGEVTQRKGRFRSEAVPILEGVRFETRLLLRQKGGKLRSGEDYLELEGVQEVTLLMVSNSSFYQDDYAEQNEIQLNNLKKLSLNDLRTAHIRNHQNLFDRVKLKLPGKELDSLPTDARLARIKEGQLDPHLAQVLFQYGRYLLIASSGPGTNPANLQGLWNPHINAPWNADYHLNINLQMNYWLADVTNLAELNQPLFDYVDRLLESGRQTALKNFGCRGSFIPHATDLWAPTWLRAPTAYWGCSVGAGGWLMQHYWEHYAFSGDTTFLRERVLPALTQVAQFYSDWIIVDPRDGYLVSAPSTSPENRFLDDSNQSAATCMGSAMDQQIIEEVFRHYLKACKRLDVSTNLRDTVESQYQQLRPGFVIGSDGRILEWAREYEEAEPGHRHMSHLYGFHPGTAVSKDDTPVLFDAVRRTLQHRLDNGGAGTGWSRAWLINCSARLLDGEMAHEHIQQLFQQSIYDNLFDAHPPFQIDGNFGFTAGVAEMLVQSHEEGKLRLLPALPKAWHTGHIKGTKVRGGLTLDVKWENGELQEAILQATADRKLTLIYGEQRKALELRAGERVVYRQCLAPFQVPPYR